MKQETAVDYLWHELIANPGNYIKAYQKAKAMEKEQIMEAYNNGEDRSAELYYNETYETSNI